MIDILSMNFAELNKYMEELGEKSFRAQQIFRWLHKSYVPDFGDMTNISKNLRERLAGECEIRLPKIMQVQQSRKDGTRKYLMKLSDGELVESVLMEYEHGLSACISSQVGCAMGCAFCASTVGGLVRSLFASEMVGQIYTMTEDIGKRISSVVVMGIGEPLDNYENLLRFIELITDDKGYDLSGRGITVSTCGLCDRIDEMSELSLPITLAVSLHASNQQKREKIMPVARRYDMDRLLATCRNYFEKTGRRLTFEYALIAGENDSERDAVSLASILKDMHAHVNLIPVNPARENMRAPDKASVCVFRERLMRLGVNATVRRTLGSDIDGACGQLRRKNI